jgi:hypothetical protein
MALSLHRAGADSAAIEDIPSSMQPEGTHHERHPARFLQLQRLSRHRLHLRLPAGRRTSRRTGRLRLQPAVQLRRGMPLRHAVPVRRRHRPYPVLRTAVDPAPPPHRGARP